ncbi:hypothetical protein Hanom_Chr03g00193091 [Helianthus anomalus]
MSLANLLLESDFKTAKQNCSFPSFLQTSSTNSAFDITVTETTEKTKKIFENDNEGIVTNRMFSGKKRVCSGMNEQDVRIYNGKK